MLGAGWGPLKDKNCLSEHLSRGCFIHRRVFFGADTALLEEGKSSALTLLPHPYSEQGCIHPGASGPSSAQQDPADLFMS